MSQALQFNSKKGYTIEGILRETESFSPGKAWAKSSLGQ
jgi:hypothetical protein